VCHAGRTSGLIASSTRQYNPSNHPIDRFSHLAIGRDCILRLTIGVNDIQTKGRPFMASAALKRIKKKLPERLAEIRGTRSQRQFARELGVFQQNVNRYENGTTPHTDFLITLATKENISLDWLLLGKGRMRRGR